MPKRSRLIAVFNSIGRALNRSGLSLVPLQEQDLLDTACQNAGLRDFGDDVFREPLGILLKACKEEARLTLIGRLALRRDTLRFLTNRLRLVNDRKRHPAMVSQEIRQPIFITGLPRTGSTLLHSLLSQDPHNRVPWTWEVMFPSPPPDSGTLADDPRVVQTEQLLRMFDRLSPNFKAIHPMGARFSTECVGILGHTFASFHFRNMYDIPSYQQWLNHLDLRFAYEFHRQFLQHLQWRSPGERWVLKAPPHIFALEAIFKTYPDARIIQTHRHPASVLASTASLDAATRSAFSDHQDLKKIGMENLTHFAHRFLEAMALRRTPGPWHAQFLDVEYEDLINDPINQLKRIYSHYNLPYTEETERRVRQFLENEPQHKRGVHRYSLEEFGLTREVVASHFRSYIAEFKLE